MLEQIKALTSISGVSGNETAVCEYIKKQITPYADKIYTDIMGNLVAVKRGGGKKVMLMAHTDEIGIVATFVDEDGFVRVSAVGGVKPEDFRNFHVTFENSARGVFKCPDKEKVKFTDCYVDIGAKSRDHALEIIDIGMTAHFDADIFECGDNIVSPALDDRIGCYILMETIKRVSRTDAELYFVFTAQEEVGLRGARVSGFDISPDIAIAIDVTDSADTPDCDAHGCKLGGGAAIKMRDSDAICSKKVIDALEKTAADNGIKTQRDVLIAGGTDIGAIQISGRGALVGGVSIAVRNVHTASETASKSDVKAAIDLICAYVEKGVENNA